LNDLKLDQWNSRAHSPALSSSLPPPPPTGQKGIDVRRGEECGGGGGRSTIFLNLVFRKKTLKFPFPILGKLPRKEVEDFIKFLRGIGGGERREI
jgi:hypothetical protein